MSPAGSSSDGGAAGGPEGSPLLLRPTVAKTFLKGVIAIAVFSVFLQLSWANLVHYLIFLGVYFAFLLTLMLLKRSGSFVLGYDSISIHRPFREPASVSYQDVLDISIAQGVLARRFGCGTVFLILKGGQGSVKLLGGGIAEQLEDVPDPQRVYELITSRLSPYAGIVDP
ncbi:MAG: PH domain-containing protein [Nitrososphaerales archaeon]